MTRPRALALVLFVMSVPAFAQQQAPDAPSATTRKPAETHRFWDKTNVLLFAGVAGARALDGASTVYMRNRGVNEWLLTNDVVDNHAGFAAIEAAGTAASYALSYVFHRTGHHTLERAVSLIHIGVATGGAIRNFTLP